MLYQPNQKKVSNSDRASPEQPGGKGLVEICGLFNVLLHVTVAKPWYLSAHGLPVGAALVKLATKSHILLELVF